MAITMVTTMATTMVITTVAATATSWQWRSGFSGNGKTATVAAICGNGKARQRQRISVSNLLDKSSPQELSFFYTIILTSNTRIML